MIRYHWSMLTLVRKYQTCIVYYLSVDSRCLTLWITDGQSFSPTHVPEEHSHGKTHIFVQQLSH